MVTWTKAAQGAIIVVLLLYCFLEAQRALQPSPPADDRWYRGDGNYNDWAMDYLPRRKD